jgi:hypothetical protein
MGGRGRKAWAEETEPVNYNNNGAAAGARLAGVSGGETGRPLPNFGR